MRIDKVAPGVGNFRGDLKDEWAPADFNLARGVGLDAAGLVVKGASVTGLVGVVIVDKTTRRAKSRIDVNTVCEIVDLPAGFSPGQKVYADNVTGVLSAVAGGAAAPAASRYVGIVMPDGRLVVRFAQS